MLGSRMAFSARNRMKLGTDRKTSTIRMRIVSTGPPAYPAMAPTTTPTMMLMIIAMNPTPSDTRMPYSARENRSRL